MATMILLAITIFITLFIAAHLAYRMERKSKENLQLQAETIGLISTSKTEIDGLYDENHLEHPRNDTDVDEIDLLHNKADELLDKLDYIHFKTKYSAGRRSTQNGELKPRRRKRTRSR